MRPNSIFRKWLLTYVGIGLAILVCVSLGLNALLQRDAYRQARQSLNGGATEIAESFGQLQQGELTIAEFRKDLKRLEQGKDIHVSIVGNKRLKYLKSELWEVGERPDVQDWVLQVRDGARVVRTSVFRKQDGERMLIVGFPLVAKGKPIASAFVYTPISDVKKMAKPLQRSLWTFSLLSAVPIALLLWFVSRRFVRPIKALSAAVEDIAGGRLSVRVRTRGADELAKLGEGFNAMAERIERIERQRKDQITDIAHELRSPLTTIRATLQGISEGMLDPLEQGEFAKLSLAEALRLGKLIDDLLELSAFEEHRITFEFADVNVNELVLQTVAQCRLKAEEKGISIGEDADREGVNGEKDIILRADAGRLRQALLNLAENAIRHCVRGTAVTVGVSREPGGIRISVKDNGQGIAAEHLPHLFDRLYKGDPSRTSKGSGLGLTITRHIVEAHHGRVEVESVPGVGTTFAIRLPFGRK